MCCERMRLIQNLESGPRRACGTMVHHLCCLLIKPGFDSGKSLCEVNGFIWVNLLWSTTNEKINAGKKKSGPRGYRRCESTKTMTLQRWIRTKIMRKLPNSSIYINLCSYRIVLLKFCYKIKCVLISFDLPVENSDR